MNNNLPLISIVVPIYNVANYLNMCIDSIINQTYMNLEIILINDGSKDDSGRICDEYAANDSRIVVIHQDNQGVAQARNNGIARAHGEYIMFVDGDDWVDLDMCESLMTVLIQYNVQSVMCAYVREYPCNSLPRVLHSENIVWSGSEFQRKVCGPINDELSNPAYLDCYVTMWGKLYPYDLIKGVTVTDLSLIGTTEDALYNLEAFCNIESILYINKPFYHYRKELRKSVSGSYKPKLESQWDNLYEKMLKVIEGNKCNDIYLSALNNRIALNILGIGLNCIQDNSNFIKKYRRIKKALSHKKRNEALKQLSTEYMPIYWKLFYFSARHKLALLFYIMVFSINVLKGKI